MPVLTPSLQRYRSGAWRMLGALHWHDRAAGGSRLGLEQVQKHQQVDRDDFAALFGDGLIEATWAGDPLTSAQVRTVPTKSVMVEITRKGSLLIWATPAILILTSIGRGHRYLAKDVHRTAASAMSAEEFTHEVILLEQSGHLIVLGGDGPGRVPTDRLTARQLFDGKLRLKVSRVGGRYIPFD